MCVCVSILCVWYTYIFTLTNPKSVWASNGENCIEKNFKNIDLF